MTAGTEPLLAVERLRTWFAVRRGMFGRVEGWLRAVDDVSLTIAAGRTLGLVGESGCGKSTLGRTILRLMPATSGRVRFGGRDVFELRGAQLRALRREMQIVFQDPYGSLDPRMTIGQIVSEPLAAHGLARGREARERAAELLRRVGLDAGMMSRYPHALSGGQRQRVGIARAMASGPRLIVCDEPVSALDVSVQSQIINLLSELQGETEVAYLFIAHNLAVVRHLSEEVAVMYLGRIVEEGPTEAVFENPRHPYTQALLASAPDVRVRRPMVVLPGEPGSAVRRPEGCAFAPRCPFAEARCQAETPELRGHSETTSGQRVACHFADRIRPGELVRRLHAPAA